MRNRSRSVALTIVVVLIAGLAWGGWHHHRLSSEAATTQQQERDFVPNVRVARAKPSGQTQRIDLPGATEAFEEATVNARATGYISRRVVDIGSPVKTGDLLAVIASPDLDQQLAQARAQLTQSQAALIQANANERTARANYDLAVVTNERTATLNREGWETRQDADNARLAMAARRADLGNAQAGVQVAHANVAAAQAAVDRLVHLTDYEQVVAPFEGVVTQRNVDVGDLVSADTGSTLGSSPNTMFVISRGSKLRVRTDIPQSQADGIVNGLPAEITVPELAERVFKGTVARTSVALAAGSRTLRAEIDVDNSDHQLRPGLYARVSIDVPRRQQTVTIPAEALIFNAGGTQVATVADGTVSLRKVEILRDHGTYLELASGLNGDEHVILNPFAALTDGQKVKADDGEQTASAPSGH
jgi:RND family efflux transporter MFP subunit